MLRITIKSALRTCSSLLPTSDAFDVPVDMEFFIRQVRQVAECLAWEALGYPENDFLAWGSPWVHLEEQAEQEEEPCVCSRCGRPGRQHLSEAVWCSSCDRWDFRCTCDREETDYG